MAEVTYNLINQIPQKTTAGDTDVLAIATSTGVTNSITVSNLFNKISGLRVDEILEAEQELYAMIIKYANLPANAYQLKQVGDDIVLFSEETLAHESKGEGKEE